MLTPPWRVGAPSYGESWIRPWLIDATMVNAKHTVVNDMMLSANINARTMIHQHTDGDCERHGQGWEAWQHAHLNEKLKSINIC